MSLWGTQGIYMTRSCVGFCYLRTFLNSCPLDPWYLERECPWKVPRITELYTFPFLLPLSSLPQCPYFSPTQFSKYLWMELFSKVCFDILQHLHNVLQKSGPQSSPSFKNSSMIIMFARNKLKLRHVSLFLKIAYFYPLH